MKRDDAILSARSLLGLCLLLGTLLLFAQPQTLYGQGALSLTTGNAGNNGQAGVSFELTATQSLKLYRFACELYAGTHTVEIWVNYNGLKTGTTPNTTGWSLVGSATNVTGATPAYTTIPVNLNLTMAPADKWGFIIMCSGNLRYQNGVTPYLFSDSYLTIDTQAWGMTGSGPNSFGFSFYIREFCGTVYYDPGFTGMNNAGLTEISSPTTFCSGAQAVTTKLVNDGLNQITSLTVNWTVNGVSQTPYSWTGLMDTLTPASRLATATIHTGYNFLPNVDYSIRAWTSNPNGVADTVNDNDTSQTFVRAGLSGTYTVGGSSPDFDNCVDAVDALVNYGVCGPVVFTVRPGIYNGQLILPPIAGASLTNTVTFNGQDRNNCIIQYSTLTQYSSAILLDGADFIRFNNLTIKATGTTYGTGVHLTNQADYNEITGCNVWVNPGSTSTNFAGILASTKTSMSGGGNHANYNLIEDNLITGGYYGVSMYGTNSTTQCTGNQVIGNEINDYHYYGVRMYYQSASKVNGNDIEDRASNTSSYGVYLYYNRQGPEAIGNHIVAGYYGIYARYCNQDSTTRGKIINNMITTWGTSTNYPLRIDNSFMFDVQYNSVNALTSGTVYGLYLNNGTSNPNMYHDVRNNTVRRSYTGTFYPFYVYPNVTPLSFIAFSNNNYYTTGSYTFRIGSSPYSSVAAIQAARPGFFLGSMQVDPQYYTNTDLHAKSVAMNNGGTAVSGLTTDIDGDPRSGTTPDIGADEYTPPTLDVGITAIILPSSGCGLTTTETVSVMLQNSATVVLDASVNPVPITVQVTGPVSQTLNATMASGIIPPGATVPFVVSTNANLATLGKYYFTATASMVGDQYAGNNSSGPVSMISDLNVTAFPYFEDFESDNGFWNGAIITGLVSTWEWGVPDYIGTTPGSVRINTAHSGTNVWMTGLNSGYSNMESSALESPCFDFTNLTMPVLKFWMNISTEPDWDGVIVEASSNGGVSWAKIMPYSPAYWNNSTFGYLAPPKYSGNSVTGWNRYVFQLTAFAGMANVQLRIVMSGDEYETGTGCAIDDIEIGDFHAIDLTVSHIQFDNSVEGWARIENEPHVIEATIRSLGYGVNPASLTAVYKAGSVPLNPGDGIAETVNPTWNGDIGSIGFTTPYVPMGVGPLPFYVRLFASGDGNAANDYNTVLPIIQDDKTLGYEDFELLTPPNWEKGFTVEDPNGGMQWVLQSTSGVGGSLGATYPGDTRVADDWFITPAANVLPGTAYSIALKYRSRSGLPQTFEIAHGTSPNPATMTVLATYSGFTNTDFIDALNANGIEPWFNTPITPGPQYLGIHVTSPADRGPVDIDDFRFFESPIPPPKIAYGNDPDWTIDPSIPILFSAVYKKSGMLSKTYTVINNNGAYGNPYGDMLWNATSPTDWVTVTMSTPDPLEYLSKNPFTPPWPRQFQTFTLDINTSTMVPGMYYGELELDAYLYNDVYQNGVQASNVPFIVPLELNVTTTGGVAQPDSNVGSYSSLDAAGNPWIYRDPQHNVYATVWVVGGTIPSMTITSFPSRLPKHISHYRFVNHYWVIDAPGTGWIADVQFHYFDSELTSHFVQDEDALRGMRIAPGTGFWEDPIFKTWSAPDAPQNYVLVAGITPANHAGQIALAHDWNLFPGKQGAANVPDTYSLDQNYPNPFNPNTEIRFGIPAEEHVTLIVMNSLGEEVANIVSQVLPAGFHVYNFDANDMPSGMYMYTLKAGNFIQTRTMILSK
jgi:hypothetical protein